MKKENLYTRMPLLGFVPEGEIYKPKMLNPTTSIDTSGSSADVKTNYESRWVAGQRKRGRSSKSLEATVETRPRSFRGQPTILASPRASLKHGCFAS